jgi:deoxyadenosine/deoxycytidine kinase|tara:strand:+ start:623 stop:1249 length:627 start_codon:yes stop_codon:yes gene_type:complete
LIKKPFIGIAGNIGVGKTTFAEILSKKLDINVCYESVDDNPYLSDFYKDMERWSFNLQIYFLQNRFKSHIDIIETKAGIIQDRTIYEDVSIFAYNLYKMGIMSKRDWDTYNNIFFHMTKFLKKPDLIIYLRASTDTLINRIKKRSRSYEKDIDEIYLHRLNIYYKKWFLEINDFNVLEIDTNNFNIFSDFNKLENIYIEIENKLRNIK